MRLLFWRKPKPTNEKPQPLPAAATKREHHSAQSGELDETLTFAREYLLAHGARLTTESTTLLAAQLPGGSEVRYTTSPTVAQTDALAEALLPGTTALTAMLDDVAAQAHIVSLCLPPPSKLEETTKRLFSAPAKNCGRCLDAQVSPFDACDACPLLEGKQVLGGLEKITSVRVIREWEETSVELVYRITAHDHYGRIDDLVRIARDTTGNELPSLPDAVLARMQGQPLAGDTLNLLRQAISVVRPEIERRTGAVAAFLRVRGSAEYARRRDEISGAFAAMQAEQDANRAVLSKALKAELERLDEVYGADVEASVMSGALIRSPMAEVEITDNGRHTLRATIDIGREFVRTVQWDGPVHHTESVKARNNGRLGDNDTQLTVSALDSLPANAFAHVMRWLLESAGAKIESSSESASSVRFHCTRAGRPLETLVVRPLPGLSVAARDVRQAAALASAKHGATTLLVSTAPASDEAKGEAERLGVEVWDRETIANMLLEQADSYGAETSKKVEDIQARVAVAAEVRAQTLQAAEAMESLLTAAPSSQKLRTLAQVTTAATAIEHGRGEASRTLLALETIVAELRAAFGERPARDGSLELVASAATLKELVERVAHLAPLAIAAIGEVANQPATGDFGYTVWHKVVVEELTARCESLRWRTAALDPTKWRDFGKALDGHAQAQAEISAAAAERAGNRATVLATELTSRAVPS